MTSCRNDVLENDTGGLWILLKIPKKRPQRRFVCDRPMRFWSHLPSRVQNLHGDDFVIDVGLMAVRGFWKQRTVFSQLSIRSLCGGETWYGLHLWWRTRPPNQVFPVGYGGQAGSTLPLFGQIERIKAKEAFLLERWRWGHLQSCFFSALHFSEQLFSRGHRDPHFIFFTQNRSHFTKSSQMSWNSTFTPQNVSVLDFFFILSGLLPSEVTWADLLPPPRSHDAGVHHESLTSISNGGVLKWTRSLRPPWWSWTSRLSCSSSVPVTSTASQRRQREPFFHQRRGLEKSIWVWFTNLIKAKLLSERRSSMSCRLSWKTSEFLWINHFNPYLFLLYMTCFRGFLCEWVVLFQETDLLDLEKLESFMCLIIYLQSWILKLTHFSQK